MATEAARSERYVEEVIELIQAKLKENELLGDVSGRVKHVYTSGRRCASRASSSIRSRTSSRFRVITKEMPGCYEALGIVHTLWKPVPGRFKDFIAIPKPNMYQSLHTTVMGPSATASRCRSAPRR